jgi:hypothetical protein
VYNASRCIHPRWRLHCFSTILTSLAAWRLHCFSTILTSLAAGCLFVTFHKFYQARTVKKESWGVQKKSRKRKRFRVSERAAVSEEGKAFVCKMQGRGVTAEETVDWWVHGREEKSGGRPRQGPFCHPHVALSPIMSPRSVEFPLAARRTRCCLLSLSLLSTSTPQLPNPSLVLISRLTRHQPTTYGHSD